MAKLPIKPIAVETFKREARKHSSPAIQRVLDSITPEQMKATEEKMLKEIDRKRIVRRTLIKIKNYTIFAVVTFCCGYCCYKLDGGSWEDRVDYAVLNIEYQDGSKESLRFEFIAEYKGLGPDPVYLTGGCIGHYYQAGSMFTESGVRSGYNGISRCGVKKAYVLNGRKNEKADNREEGIEGNASGIQGKENS